MKHQLLKSFRGSPLDQLHLNVQHVFLIRLPLYHPRPVVIASCSNNDWFDQTQETRLTRGDEQTEYCMNNLVKRPRT